MRHNCAATFATVAPHVAQAASRFEGRLPDIFACALVCAVQAYAAPVRGHLVFVLRDQSAAGAVKQQRLVVGRRVVEHHSLMVEVAGYPHAA